MRQVLDAVMKKGAKDGPVKAVKRSKAIEFEDEQKMWDIGTFGSWNPKQLMHTLLYHLGMHLSLRTAQEHRDLEHGESSQIQLITDKNGCELLVYEYTERSSKNKSFGFEKLYNGTESHANFS